MLTSRTWTQRIPTFQNREQSRQTFTGKMAASQKAYIYEGRVRDSETGEGGPDASG